MSTIPVVDVDPTLRKMITPANLGELGITAETVEAALKSQKLVIEGVSPDGVSINDTNFGNFSGPTASTLGWISYYNIGAPLVEERANIIRPIADTLSARQYENRTGTAQSFEDSIEFTISNTFRWSLQGAVTFSIEGSMTGEESSQYQESIQQSLQELVSQNLTIHNHKDNIGTQTDSLAQASVTDTATDTTTGTDTGSSTMSAQLQLALTGSIGGELTTSWTSRSSVSGVIPANARVGTMVSQRRQIVQQTYELPINFGGFVALHYPEPVSVQQVPPQAPTPAKSTVIAQDILLLGLVDPSLGYRPKGVAEIISRLNVDHTIFGSENLTNQNQGFATDREHYM